LTTGRTPESAEAKAAMKYTNDSDLPVVTDEQLQESLKKTREYTVLILKAGPEFEVPGPARASGVTTII
jgi:hypothetical protein